jgi:hypothetical protein
MFGAETQKILYEPCGIESMRRLLVAARQRVAAGSDILDEWSAIRK